MTRTPRTVSADMLEFIAASPSPYHAVAEAAKRLDAAGFTEVSERERWEGTGKQYVIRDGALVAWDTTRFQPEAGFRIVGAHTDSPNLRIKPQPEVPPVAGFRQVGVEVYGGALYNSWLDRDLGLSGRVALRGEHTPLLVHTDVPLFRIPQLAIHLDNAVNREGLVLNAQRHLVPLHGLVDGGADHFGSLLAELVGVAEDAIVSWDLMLHDTQAPAFVGQHQDLIASPRIDNQASCHVAVHALAGATAEDGAPAPVVCLFDHEEVGSVSASGAGSSLLPTIFSRVMQATGADAEDMAVALGNSVCLSADGAHATHPNYADRHEPAHNILLNAGPAVKRNSNERYATSARGHAVVAAAIEQAAVPSQVFVNRTDLACGSTIGPVTAAQLGIPTVDVGMPQLAMHSARECCGSDDPDYFAAMLGAFFAPASRSR